jgi:hypothetical protein
LVVHYMPDGLIGFVESTLARLRGAKR